MKVVQVIDRLNVGGAERVLVDLCNLLFENQCDVTVVCLLKEGELDSHLNRGIPVVYLRRKNKFNPIYLIKLYRILIQFDIIHIHLRQVLRYVSLLFYSNRLHKKKVVIFHDHFGQINTEKEISSSIKEALKRCSAYIGVSSQLTNWAEANKVNSVIIKLTNIVRVNENILKANRSLTKLDIVSVGNFRPQKNYEFLCHLIAHSSRDFTYTVYGKIVDVEYYYKIIALLNQLKIEDRVNIITDCNSVISELPKYHLGLHCAISETGPLVALEYLSVQLPFIAFNTGEVIEDISSYFPNFIQQDFNVEKWNEAINLIVKDREDYVAKLKSFFKENYSEDVFLTKCMSIYKQLLTN